ncbi:MAG: hypothetical protein WDO74_35475 [Pseudomonadota bacterium]
MVTRERSKAAELEYACVVVNDPSEQGQEDVLTQRRSFGSGKARRGPHD